MPMVKVRAILCCPELRRTTLKFFDLVGVSI